MKILAGSLEIVEVFNGYTLYGKDDNGDDTFIAHVGDGVDSFVSDSDYNPNDDYDLSEAYGFDIVPLANYLIKIF